MVRFEGLKPGQRKPRGKCVRHARLRIPDQELVGIISWTGQRLAKNPQEECHLRGRIVAKFQISVEDEINRSR